MRMCFNQFAETIKHRADTILLFWGLLKVGYLCLVICSFRFKMLLPIYTFMSMRQAIGASGAVKLSGKKSCVLSANDMLMFPSGSRNQNGNYTDHEHPCETFSQVGRLIERELTTTFNTSTLLLRSFYKCQCCVSAAVCFSKMLLLVQQTRCWL